MKLQSAGETESEAKDGGPNPKKRKLPAVSSELLVMGSKRRKQMESSLQEHVSAPASDFAYRQLQKMGWSEGTGLGKNRDGISTHLKVKKRDEQTGLGTEKQRAEQAAMSESWWKDGIGDTLSKLSSIRGKKKEGKKRKKQRNFTDEELFEATGGVRFGMRAAPTKNLAKWRRTESELSTSSSTGVSSVRKSDAPMDSDEAAIDTDGPENNLSEPSSSEASGSSGKKKRKKSKKKKKEKKENKEKKSKHKG